MGTKRRATRLSALVPDNREDVERILADPRLARVHSQLRGLLRPGIRLTASACADDAIALGGSKLGGCPDLPPGLDWPRARLRVPKPSPGFVQAYGGGAGPRQFPLLPDDGRVSLPFVAQIDLGDVAALDGEGVLPRSGRLYVFYNDVAYYSDGGEQNFIRDHLTGISYGVYDFGTPANWWVAYSAAASSELRRCAVPDDVPGQARYGACTLSFTPEITLPHVETCFIGEPDALLTRDEWSAYAELLYEARANAEVHQMLGHSDDVQPYAMENSYRAACPTLFGRAADADELATARLLLQVSKTPSGMHFGRDGRLYLFMRAADLARRDFSKVWGVTQ